MHGHAGLFAAVVSATLLMIADVAHAGNTSTNTSNNTSTNASSDSWSSNSSSNSSTNSSGRRGGVSDWRRDERIDERDGAWRYERRESYRDDYGVWRERVVKYGDRYRDDRRRDDDD